MKEPSRIMSVRAFLIYMIGLNSVNQKCPYPPTANLSLHEALNNVTPADVYYGRDQKIFKKRENIKKKTMQLRRRRNCVLRLAN
jgi:hypothetical protein